MFPVTGRTGRGSTSPSPKAQKGKPTPSPWNNPRGGDIFIRRIKNEKVHIFVMVFGLIIFSCDVGNGTNEDEFVVSTNDTVLNTMEILDLAGTSAISSNTSVATVESPPSDKIKITSVAEGAAVITVSDDSGHEAAIPVTVSKKGAITIGTIDKYSGQNENPFVGSWHNSKHDITLVCYEDLTWTITLKNSDDPEVTITAPQGKGTYNQDTGLFIITHIKNETNQFVDQIPADTEHYKPSVVFGITTLPVDYLTGGIVSGNKITFAGDLVFDKVP
jgi:hypothetical protein